VGTSDDAIDDLAQAVLDSEPVNWTEAETTPARRLVRHLRVVDAVARARRSGSAGHAAGERRPPPPESWGHLRIIERIGGGAYGDVYRAWDTQLEREVALKLLPPEGPEAEAETRLREGRLLARVRHSNVVTIYGADRIDGRTGLWMELVRGTTLDDLVRSGRAFEPSEVARTGVALARALQAVHSAGLLHRDVKAQNVVRDEDGRHVLMDFGTGRGLDERESDLTGTPLYLAPEILRGQPASVQTDVYSLGVLLFHLLTRSFPVTGAAIRDLRQAHELEARTDVHTLRQDVPRRLVRIVQRAIEPSPQARYPTAEALAADLEAAAAPPRRRWPWIAAAAVVALVIGALPWRAPEPLTIAILPVESPQGAVDTVLADGITIDLTTRLSQIAGVSVRAASSSLAYRDRARPRDLAAFGRDLDATHVLEAGLFGESNTISRVQASLVRMTDQRAVWTDTFDAKEANLFAVRERVAQGVAGALGLRFAQDQRTYETEPGLQRLFLRAQALRDRRDTESRTRAAILFEEVGRADPDFVPAVAGLARALLTVEKDRDAEPPLDPRAEPLAISAYAADDTLPEAIAAMGLLCAHRHRWACAREHFEQAIRAAPAMTSTYTDFVITRCCRSVTWRKPSACSKKRASTTRCRWTSCGSWRTCRSRTGSTTWRSRRAGRCRPKTRSCASSNRGSAGPFTCPDDRRRRSPSFTVPVSGDTALTFSPSWAATMRPGRSLRRTRGWTCGTCSSMRAWANSSARSRRSSRRPPWIPGAPSPICGVPRWHCFTATGATRRSGSSSCSRADVGPAC
jgi:TolB-like protein